MIDFSVEPEFQEKLDWMNEFVREECETMDLLFPDMGLPYDTTHEPSRRHLKPLQEKVKAMGLWACHLGPNLGGPGYGQVKLALMNEIIGRSRWAPTMACCISAAPSLGRGWQTERTSKRVVSPLTTGTSAFTIGQRPNRAASRPMWISTRCATSRKRYWFGFAIRRAAR